MKDRNKIESKEKNILDKVLVIILSLYSTFTLLWSCYSNINIFNFVFLSIFMYIIISFIFKKVDNLKIKNSEKITRYEYLIYALIICIPLFISFLAYYPGGATVDTYNQWNQVQSNYYSNWHPVMETLIMLKIPSLFYNNIVSATVFQELLIFLIMMYFCKVLRDYFLNKKETIVVLLLMVLNPIFIKYSALLWKDVIFSWCIFLSTICLIQIMITKEEWIKKHHNKCIFIIANMGILYFRHNGIIPFIFVFLGCILFLKNNKRFYIISFVTILISFFIIQGPIYKYFKINSETGGKTEIMGVVFGQLAYYYNNDIIKFNEEEKQILSKFADLDLWKSQYAPNNFNLIKWNSNSFSSNEDDINAALNLWISKSIKYPLHFVRSYLNMTSPIWEMKDIYNNVDYDHDKLENKIISFFYNNIVDYNAMVTYSPLRAIFINFGQGLLIIILALFLTIRKTKFVLKKYLPYIPAIINTLVVMCVITGEEVRFVYSQVLVAIPLLIYALFGTLDDKNFDLKKEM